MPVANKHQLIDMSGSDLSGVADGMRLDVRGNIYCTGPGGVWIISPAGNHLRTIKTPDRITNLFSGTQMERRYT